MGIPALPFSKLVKTIHRTPKGYPVTITSIGDHIRKRRLDLKLLQEDVARLLGTSEASITNWEIGLGEPQIRFYPKIIGFLGYFPWIIDTATLEGKIKVYRYINGLSHKKLGALIGKNASTISDWEEGKSNPSVKNRHKLLSIFP